jgi:hypothetical protein
MHFRFSDGDTEQSGAVSSSVHSVLVWGNQLEHSELAAVLKSMGLQHDKPILHADHSMVLAFKAENPDKNFILAPEAKGDAKSSILAEKAPVF